MLWLVTALALTQAPPNPWVANARALVGVRYEFGGRLRKREGIDCLGLVLASAEKATGCGWRGYSVNPTELVTTKALGEPVEGLSPVSSEALTHSKLKPGDVVMLLSTVANPAEPALAALEGAPLWVWHVGIASDAEGQWLVGDHHAGKVVETNLAAYLREHHDEYSAVYVVRPAGQKPKSCRKHAPMKVLRSP